jgi:hypothetical protein
MTHIFQIREPKPGTLGQIREPKPGTLGNMNRSQAATRAFSLASLVTQRDAAVVAWTF